MIKITDQYFWNLVFLLFFAGMVTMGVIILQSESRFLKVGLQPLDYILMTLATWRLVRLFVYDTIMKFFREQFWDLKKVGRGYELVKPPHGPRRTLADLIGCPSCISIWMAATVMFFYLLTPYAVIPVTILALSAVALFMQNLGTLVACGSEYLSSKTRD